MSWVYRGLIRPVLFKHDAESMHELTLRALAWAGRHELVCDALASFLGPPKLPIDAFGLRFPNPVGLGAGMDKQADALPAWAAMGFGFTELGGVTCHAQPGNARPRIFRAVRDGAIINRMGFNNPGAEAVAWKLAAWRALGRWPDHPVGINLGKSKVTPLEEAAEDYANSFRVLRPHADFFVVNVSSPNTPNLRQLQNKALLDEILAALQEANVAAPCGSAAATSDFTHTRIPSASGDCGRSPILIKVAPDLSFAALDEILELVQPRQIAGIVATNTTITRPQSDAPELGPVYAEEGGLSGRPLRTRSTEVVRHLFRETRGTLPIIGVGGIFDAADAWEKIAAGACLVQVYTGMVYNGPTIAKTIVEGLFERMSAAGLTDLRQAVGCEAA